MPALCAQGTLGDIGAYQPYTLVGPPVYGLVLDPPAAFTLSTVYIFVYNSTIPCNYIIACYKSQDVTRQSSKDCQSLLSA